MKNDIRNVAIGISILVTAISLLIWASIRQMEYEARHYVSYDRYSHPSSKHTLLVVRKNLDGLFNSVPDYDYVAIEKPNGQIVPLKNQFLPYDAAQYWSKDGELLAFKIVYPVPKVSNSTNVTEIDGGKQFAYVYDFSTNREIFCGSEPSKTVKKLMNTHGWPNIRLQPTNIIIGLNEQTKFEKADVNQHIYFMD